MRGAQISVSYTHLDVYKRQHQELSRERIEAAVEKLRHHGNEIYLGVTPDNQRYYINPVRNEEGELLGYFERFELNLQK